MNHTANSCRCSRMHAERKVLCDRKPPFLVVEESKVRISKDKSGATRPSLGDEGVT